MKNILLISMLLLVLSSNTFAQDIYVKYRGMVDVSNGQFKHLSLKDSKLIKSMYHDNGNSYLLVQLKSTYYHYCSIPQGEISNWRKSASLGRYYKRNIKGRYSCKGNPVPNY